MKARLAEFCPGMEEPVFVEGAGHWIQQEEAAPDEGGAAILLRHFPNLHCFSIAARMERGLVTPPPSLRRRW
jgi:hypothetical protein